MGDKRKAEVIVLTASGESDEASETDAGRTEAKRRRGGERTAAEAGEGASRARAVDAEDEESTQAGDAGKTKKTKKAKKARLPRSAKHKASKAERAAKRWNGGRWKGQVPGTPD